MALRSWDCQAGFNSGVLLEQLETRILLSVMLNWAGAGNALNLTEGTSGSTPTVTVSEPSTNLLKIDLGTGKVFAAGSTASATGLTWQNAGSPTTSQYATIDISTAGNITALQAALAGDKLTLGAILDSVGGLGSISASAGTIEVAGTGINTSQPNSNVDLRATGNLTVDSGATLQTGTGTISLAADTKADGSGDDGTGTLSIGAAATVVSTSTSASAITLRGADVDIDTSANPAVVGAIRSLASTATNLGLSGLHIPNGLAFDSSGNLYVSSESGGAVSKFAPGATTPSATLTGLSSSAGLAFDSSGNLYVANYGGDTVSKFAPGATTPTATLTGLSSPWGLTFDSSGNLYVANYGSDTVSKFAPGSTTPSATLTGLDAPTGLAFDSSGNLYVANAWGNSVSKFAPGSTTPTNSGLTGLNTPTGLAFDSSGNLYVANYDGNTVSKFAPGSTTPTNTLTGVNLPENLAFDSSGNLYVANASNNTVSKFAQVLTPAAGKVVIRSSLPSRPMSLGGANAAVAGVNLTDAELAQIQTISTGTVTVGDAGQTGDITFTTATLATTAGASTVVVQSTGGAGKIILDDSDGAVGLNGNSGTVTITAGSGGISASLVAGKVSLASQGFNASGLSLHPALNSAPALGAGFTVVDNTDSSPITGTFDGLAEGATTSASYLGTTYYFQITYRGGIGNDVILTAVAAPTDIALSVSNIETNQTDGTTVGSLSTTDLDSSTFIYTLVSGTGDTDNASFTISGSTLKTNAVFNYAAQNSYSILVRSTDELGLYTEKAFTISVAPALAVTTPAVSCDSTQGLTYRISWAGGTGSTTVQLWSNGPNGSTKIADSVSGSLGYYDWDTTSVPHGWYCFTAQVNPGRGGAAYASNSPNWVHVVNPNNHAPTITLTTSATAQSITKGDTYNITWTASDADSDPLQVSLWAYSTGTGWFQIPNASGLNATAGTFAWDTTSQVHGWYCFSAKVWDGSAQGAAASPNWLHIVQPAAQMPTFTFTSPASGQSVAHGNSFNITWNATVPAENASTMKVQLRACYLDWKNGNAPVWAQIATNLDPATGSFTWDTTATSTDYQWYSFSASLGYNDLWVASASTNWLNVT